MESATAMICNTTADCGQLMVCSFFNATAGVCIQKPLFDPFTMWDGLSLLVCLLATASSAGSGLGGGGLMVPLYTLLLHSPRVAIPLSKACIFGASVANVVVNARKRHPRADRPLIDWDVALMLEPATLGGTVIGVLFNRMFPSWLITMLLLLLLSYTTYKTMTKGVTLWKKERRDANSHSSEKLLLLPAPARVSVTEDGDVQKSRSTELTAILNDERIVPWRNVVLLIAVWAMVFILELLKGSSSYSFTHIICGSPVYWIVMLAPFPVMLIVMALVGRAMLLSHKRKVRVGYDYQDGDVQWNARGVFLYTAGCVIAGISAGLLGIGGGMLKIPIMLYMGMLPQVVQATGGLMVLFTSSSTTAQFLVLDALPYDYAGFFWAASFLGGLSGQLFVAWLLRKYNKMSLIVLILGVVIGVSAILMGAIGIRDMVVNGFGPFHSICDSVITQTTQQLKLAFE
eukprot:TRINITY_DN7483_c0_g1_i1.p1 TRINITY_DN7483_c0_g1~~TRINITY_DN7483_c0_g1_i1.p1  ORF type:complete len:458 (+),score=98.78 TRINITY_DN7483_c0_g1_i1:80-1453(+)